MSETDIFGVPEPILTRARERAQQSHLRQYVFQRPGGVWFICQESPKELRFAVPNCIVVNEWGVIPMRNPPCPLLG